MILVALQDPAVVFASHTGPGAFYRLMPHSAMVAIFGLAVLYAIIAMAMSVRGFWLLTAVRSRPSASPQSIWTAVKDAARPRYLDGGGIGCMNEDERPTDRRHLYHHLTFYGFLLCFASTTVAAPYHYLLAREAPYPWYDLSVVLGTIGGIGLVVGPASSPRSGGAIPPFAINRRLGWMSPSSPCCFSPA